MWFDELFRLNCFSSFLIHLFYSQVELLTVSTFNTLSLIAGEKYVVDDKKFCSLARNKRGMSLGLARV